MLHSSVGHSLNARLKETGRWSRQSNSCAHPRAPKPGERRVTQVPAWPQQTTFLVRSGTTGTAWICSVVALKASRV